MTFLPIVERELRVRSRRKSTYRFRLLAALTGILLVTSLLISSAGAGGSGGFGQVIFQLLAGFCFLYCLFEGPRNTSDALSVEKREGTLGLLFLTDLRGYDVVLGKMTATSLNSVYGLFAVFPPLAIPLVLGGVTGAEFWRTVLALLNALFLSLCLGMCISAAARDERKTWSYSTSLICLLALAPPFLLLAPNEILSSLGLASPSTALVTAREKLFLAAPARYWHSLFVVHGISWVLLIAAGIVLPRTWQDQPARTPVRVFRPGLQHRPSDASRRLEALRQTQPIAWMAARRLESNRMLWRLVLGASVVLIVSWSLNPGSNTVMIFLFLAMYALHLALAVWLASEACHLFGDARDSGALELLLATPLTEREIIAGHLLGLKRHFLRPIVTLVVVEVVLTSTVIYLLAVSGAPLAVCLFLAAVIFFMLFVALLDLQAVALYGMWMGLKNQRPARAVTLTVLHVLLLPMFALACYPLYPVIGMVKNLVFINHSRDQLRKHFRGVVTERFEPAAAHDLVGAPPASAGKHMLPPVLPR